MKDRSGLKRLRVGDYVEVLDGDTAGVDVGEQGIIIETCQHKSQIVKLMFPARTDRWGAERQAGWCALARYVKLLYRP